MLCVRCLESAIVEEENDQQFVWECGANRMKQNVYNKIIDFDVETQASKMTKGPIFRNTKSCVFK